MFAEAYSYCYNENQHLVNILRDVYKRDEYNVTRMHDKFACNSASYKVAYIIMYIIVTTDAIYNLYSRLDFESSSIRSPPHAYETVSVTTLKYTTSIRHYGEHYIRVQQRDLNP